MNNIEEIKSRLSILEVVSGYIKVDKSGSQYKARCPFHNERSPSFYVSPARGTYHCFGCGESGDIFKFVEKIENMDFKESLKILADRAGVTLSFKKREEDATLINLMRDATNFYIKSLSESPSAIQYLHERGLTDEMIKEFSIGYTVNDWRKLFVHLMTLGYTDAECVESGLVIKTDDNKYYDRFRGRIMFPIKNISGAVIGFTGRILPVYDDGKSGKYVNTPQTKLYNKSRVLYNYDKARKYIGENREVVLVEGQMDVIMSYMSGVKNVIAVSGTALTDEHVQMMGRLADNVVLALDSDAAGMKAAEKSAIMCAYADIKVYTVDIKEKDVADTVKENPNNWIEIFNQKIKYSDMLYNKYLELKNDDDKISFIRNKIAPYLKAIRSDIEREFDIYNFARKTGISPESIRSEVSKQQGNNEKVEESTPKSITSKEDNIKLEIKVLERELGLTKTIIDQEDIPDDVHNSKVIYLTERNSLNMDYYKDLIREYERINYNKEHERLTKLVQKGDHAALIDLQKLIKSKKN